MGVRGPLRRRSVMAKQTRLCLRCGTPFQTYDAWLRKSKGAGTYCSQECRLTATRVNDGMTGGERYRKRHPELAKERARAYYWSNKEKENARSKAYCDTHRDELRQKNKLYEKRPDRIVRKAELEKTDAIRVARANYRERTRGKRSAYHKIYEANYREKRRELHHARQALDPQYRLRRALRARLKQAIKNNSTKGSAIELLGCSIEKLREHLERQWLPGMSWQNFGRCHAAEESRTWQIDHVYPLSKFDLTDEGQMRVACHWTNLAPLWAVDNRRKWNKTVGGKEVPNVSI